MYFVRVVLCYARAVLVSCDSLCVCGAISWCYVKAPLCVAQRVKRQL